VSIPEWVQVGIEVLVLLGLFKPVKGYFDHGRRRSRAELIARLASDTLALVAHQRGVSPSTAADLEETIQILRTKLLGTGVSKARVDEIVRAALAGAKDQAEAAAASRAALLSRRVDAE
jgi:hypothetical protein